MLLNYMDAIAKDIYKEVVKSFPTSCNCATYEADAICMALNELPPMYNTTSIGHAYAKLSEIQHEFRVQAPHSVGSSLEKVKKLPRHST